jgi:DNA-directed RNA polymerase specialized sigma24 family protein
MSATTISDELSRLLARRLFSLPPSERLVAANVVMDELRDVMAEVSATRRSAVRDMRIEGYTLSDIANIAGTTAQRIHQIESGYNRHEKAARKRPS